MMLESCLQKVFGKFKVTLYVRKRADLRSKGLPPFWCYKTSMKGRAKRTHAVIFTIQVTFNYLILSSTTGSSEKNAQNVVNGKEICRSRVRPSAG